MRKPCSVAQVLVGLRGRRRPRADRASSRNASSAGRHSLRSAKVRPSSDQRVGLLAAIAGALVRDVGGGRGTLEEVSRARGRRRGEFAGWRGTGAASCRPRAARPRRSAPASASRRGSRAFGTRPRPRCAASRPASATCPGFGLDLGFQPDGTVCQVGSLERFVCGKGGEREEGDDRGGKAGADRREHQKPSLNPENPGRTSLPPNGIDRW